MEKGSESWLLHQQLDEQFPNAKFSKLPLNDIGMQNPCFPCAIPCTVAASTNGTLPTFGLSGLPNIKTGESNGHHGWFYCWPRSRQGLMPVTTLHDNFVPQTNLPGKVPTTGVGPASKQFLVFDQTGNKTTMMFSSGIESSVPRPTAWSRKPTCFYNFNEDELKIKSNRQDSGPNLTDDLDDHHGSIVGSDMREDSDEIDALLYSDDEDDCSDDGEETSTGHSPSTMTSFEKRDLLEEEDMDEVDSSAGPIKRQKISESDHQVPTVLYTPTPIKPNRSVEYEEDAESSCVGGQPMPFSNMSLSRGNKRVRREKIRETVSVLQTILPGVKGKDAVMVLDEAINYLRTLKFKAKSLGLSGSSE